MPNIPLIQPGVDYVYKVKVYMVNPERFFSEAMMKMPAATRQLILNTDPNFVSAIIPIMLAEFSLTRNSLSLMKLIELTLLN